MGEAVKKIEREALTEIMDWMDERFDDNIGSVAVAAAEMAVKQGYVSGVLWEEIGARTLHMIFRERMTTKRRGVLSLRTTEAQPVSRTGEEVALLEKSFPFYIDGKWYQLFDMVKEEVERVAMQYAELAAGNAFESNFLRAVACELNEGEKVRDKFNYDGIMKIRKEVANSN